METGPDRAPTPEWARKTLEQLSKDETAARYPSLPWWFFIGQATLTACLFLAQLLPPSDSFQATFAVAVAAVIMAVLHWLNRDGVSWARVSFRDMAPFISAMVGTAMLCLAVQEMTGDQLIWIAGAVIGAGIVMRQALVYRRAFNGDA